MNNDTVDNKTTDEWLYEIGTQIRTLRLRRNLDQQTLAAQAGVALNVVKRLESGRDTTMSSVIKVLRSLGQEAWFVSLAPSVSVSPLQMLRKKPARQRVSRPRGNRHV